ncbi:MAG: Fic family protein, partial [Gemmatimonadota bacterium]
MLRSFGPGVLAAQPISGALLSSVRQVGEYRGRELLYQHRSPQVLEMLREAAVIASTTASNRLEGVEAPAARVEALVSANASPANRSEQEIAGYRDVLRTIHASWEHMPFTPGVVLQLHRDLYRYVPGDGGVWKTAPNVITERRPDGTVRVRFEPVAPHETADAMAALHERLEGAWGAGEADRLLLIGAYVLDFLCIHPFLDGNGRMARLLTLWLLYRAGYTVGRYISLEQVVEHHRDGYYDAVEASSRGWHDARHSLLPWWEYFLGVVVLDAYRALDERVGRITSRRGAKRQMVAAAIRRMPAVFRYADVARACPGISRPTIQRAMREARDAGFIELLSAGRDAEWR